MTIHFPIVFMFATTLFTVLYLLTGVRSFELTAVHCLGAGMLFTPLAMASGYYTWWLNYLAKPVRAVSIKKKVSVILFSTEIAAFLWRIDRPGYPQCVQPFQPGLFVVNSFPVTSGNHYWLVWRPIDLSPRAGLSRRFSLPLRPHRECRGF